MAPFTNVDYRHGMQLKFLPLPKKTTVLVGVFFCSLMASAPSTAETLPIAALKDADLVFQTSTSSQAAAIFAATASPFTHMGMIKTSSTGPMVIEAGPGPVHEIPLSKWVRRGLGEKIAIYRYKGLSTAQSQKVLATARKMYGRAYDIFFSFENERLYCSELPYVSFRAAGLPLGQIQKMDTLNLNNFLVQSLIEARWRKHPLCAKPGMMYEACADLISHQTIVTPASIAADPNLEQVYSSY